MNNGWGIDFTYVHGDFRFLLKYQKEPVVKAYMDRSNVQKDPNRPMTTRKTLNFK